MQNITLVQIQKCMCDENTLATEVPEMTGVEQGSYLLRYYQKIWKICQKYRR